MDAPASAFSVAEKAITRETEMEMAATLGYAFGPGASCILVFALVLASVGALLLCARSGRRRL